MLEHKLKNEELNWKWIDQFRSVQDFNSNSIPNLSIQFQFNSCWIELIINSNSIHELIRALLALSEGITGMGASPVTWGE